MGVGAWANSYSIPIVKYFQQLSHIDDALDLTGVNQLLTTTGWERVGTVTQPQEYTQKGD